MGRPAIKTETIRERLAAGRYLPDEAEVIEQLLDRADCWRASYEEAQRRDAARAKQIARLRESLRLISEDPGGGFNSVDEAVRALTGGGGGERWT